MSAALQLPVNQPGVFNIHAWDGQRWRGGMNRLSRVDAINAAAAWSEQSGMRHRAYDPEGNLVFDSEATALLVELQKASATKARAEATLKRLREYGPYRTPGMKADAERAVRQLMEADATIKRIQGGAA